MEARHAFRLFAIVYLIHMCIGLDPCLDYKLLWMENGRRSSDFNSRDTAVSICDAYLNHNIWYRFEHDAGNRLIETPVEPWHCGTQAPIWLNGTHPTENITTSPTIPPMTTPSSPTEAPSSGWSSWGPWSVCSKPCDYGLQSRKRKCGQLPCEGPASSSQLCNEYNCPDLPDEKDEGIVLLLQSADYTRQTMLTVVENEQKINTIMRININAICSQSASLCCGHTIGSTFTVSMEYVTSSDIYVAQGFPRPKSELVVYYKIIAVVNEDVDKAICRGNNSKRRSVRQTQSGSPRFVSYDVMEMATKDSSSTIEQETGLNVNGYIHPSAVPDDDDNNPCPPATCVVPIVVCCTVIAAIAVIIGCICLGKKKSKTKPEPEPNPPAYEYIAADDQCNSVVTPVGLYVVATSVNTGQEQLPEKQFVKT